jgi:NAD(P)H-dependent nitrite reductase small subunit
MTDIVDTAVDRPTGLAVTDAVVGPERATAGGWARVCPVDRLTPWRGVAARVADRQVALFRVPGEQGDEVFALDNRDPFSGAHVLARGIVGDAGGVPKVTSPVYKQGFDLRTGTCLDDAEVAVPAYRATVGVDGWVSVAVPVP